MMMSSVHPSASPAGKPKSLAAAPFHVVIAPAASLTMIASAACSSARAVISSMSGIVSSQVVRIDDEALMLRELVVEHAGDLVFRLRVPIDARTTDIPRRLIHPFDQAPAYP